MKLYVIVSMYNAYGEHWLWSRAYVFSNEQKAKEFLEQIKKDNPDSEFNLVETELIN